MTTITIRDQIHAINVASNAITRTINTERNFIGRAIVGHVRHNGNPLDLALAKRVAEGLLPLELEREQLWRDLRALKEEMKATS